MVRACRAGGGRRNRRLQVFARHEAVAKPRVMIHSNCLSATVTGQLGNENFRSRKL
jgi:hypothetical protein